MRGPGTENRSSGPGSTSPGRKVGPGGFQMRSLVNWTVIVAAFVLPLCLGINGNQFNDDPEYSKNPEEMPHQEVEHWAQKIGTHIFQLANGISKHNEIEANYKEHNAHIKENDGLNLVKEMAQDVTNMMKFKVEAVKRIMNVAEEASLDQDYHKEEEVDYFNAKRINEWYPSAHKSKANQLIEGYKKLDLEENQHFDGKGVNTNHSTVHVPTNVFDKAPDVLNAIRWSEALDRTFISNYEIDPTLSWQYFGSSTGFLRQYPGIKWEMDEEDPDLYDSRLRSWYIEAANSPKDMVVLLDISGSMTGIRKEIAKHVVINILDTLNENDFVNVFTFNDETNELVSCFNNTLVQANLENIGEFKNNLSTIETANIANFSLALTKAFELLARYNKSGHGSQCNQAIMLVTDGAPHNYEKLFEQYNWPHLQVRIFTYLIGREVTDIWDLRWMACANKGYFVHVTTKEETREQVLKYIPVMARPMVMYQNEHPHIWTGVYADIAGRRDAPGEMEGYRLMTSVSVPVFDRKKTSVRTANLLGVAGTDVPIEEIQKLVPPYQLGVNGYSFMVNKNGYVLYHPDMRPVHEEANAEFQDILKPNYNSVDLSEVELVDNLDPPRANHSELLDDYDWELLEITKGREYNTQLRNDMIDQTPRETVLNVKIHLDDMKRVVTRKQKYSTKKIQDTPFSLGIALPEGYGYYKVHGQVEISRETLSHKLDIDKLFDGNWRIHPDWVYCEYRYNKKWQKREDRLMDFIKRAQQPGWKWRSTRTRPPPEPTMNAQHCDKELVQSLVFDARVTDVYKNVNDKQLEDNEQRNKSFGITTAFVATRSGLTRWLDLNKDAPTAHVSTEKAHFMEIHNKAIDEIWYKRAVDYFLEDEEAYVYSVPFDAHTRPPGEVMVTATRAIFVKESNYHKAPAAVVGVTMKHEKFVDFFKNETYKCPAFSSSKCRKSKTCDNEFLDCYLLDDNGFIIASEKFEDTGRFFGEKEGTIMESLVQSEVYKKVKIYDYQAVCLDPIMGGSFASRLLTPFQMISWTANWIVSNIMWVLFKTQLYQLWDPNAIFAYQGQNGEEPIYTTINEPPMPDSKDPIDVMAENEPNEDYIPDYVSDQPVDYIDEVIVTYADDDYDNETQPDYDEKCYYTTKTEGDPFPVKLAFINKTRPRPCDKEVDLYKLQLEKLKDPNKLYKPVKGKLSNCHSNGCGRPFSVQKVEYTNLVLIAVHNLCPCESRNVDITPREVEYNETMHCQRLLLNHYRRRPTECFNYHPDEEEIRLCGGGTGNILPSATLIFILSHVVISYVQRMSQ
ncbi:unnamed protein product, partial [Meganyctiphanes norvegica]